MMDATKYAPGYYPVPAGYDSWVKKDHIEKAPAWCSVDLRDGNQSLIVPMNLEEKLEFYDMLVKIGFKEIEVGFPAASETEYEFLRTLIDGNRIPQDVTVQVLTQCREHLVKRTFEAIQGIKKAVVHIYNSTSTLQRDVVFHMDREEIKKIATDGVAMVKNYMKDHDGEVVLEYSPESFTGTELDFALDICNAVQRAWGPTPEHKMIMNLPSTVEMTTPNVYADQIEWMNRHLENRESIILSVHPHNDRGTGVAATELALLAGADRVEGTLFGNGERTGNVDLVTLALNLYSHGVDPQLDLSDLPRVAQMYEESTGMQISPRHPYGGELVFAAFSGSHQDAIAKGFRWRKQHPNSLWNVPYLPLDPRDIGRSYEHDVIRINSQSGKGGIGYLLEHHYGINLPKKMREEFGYRVKSISEQQSRELSVEELHRIFKDTYLNLSAPICLEDFYFVHKDIYRTTVLLQFHGQQLELTGRGNGRFDAVSNALGKGLDVRFHDIVYQEHALERGSTSRAIAYIGITSDAGRQYWGCGIHTDIIAASVYALFSAINRMLNDQTEEK